MRIHSQAKLNSMAKFRLGYGSMMPVEGVETGIVKPGARSLLTRGDSRHSLSGYLSAHSSGGVM